IALAHPLGVAAGEIVVDGYDVDALPLERVEVDRKRCDERLALASLHLGDFAAVKRDAADQLDVIVPLAKCAHRRLADRGEGFRKQVVELLAIGEPFAEALGLRAQFIVGKGLDRGLEAVDRVDIFAEAADITIVGRSEDAFCHCGEHENPLKPRAFGSREIRSPTLWETAPGDVRSTPCIVNSREAAVGMTGGCMCGAVRYE